MSQQLTTLRAWVGARPDRPGPTARHVLVVAGGKGGTGASTASALLAFGAASAQRATLLVDAASPGIPLTSVLGMPAPAEDGDQPVWRDIAPGLTLAELPRAATTPAERRSLLRRIAGRYDDYGFVVVDAGATAEALNSAVSIGASRLLAVTTADRLSVVATYALLKYAADRYPTLPAAVLVNRSDPASATEAFARIVAATQEFLGGEPAAAGSLPEDEAVRAAMEAGAPPFAMDGPARHAALLLAELLIAKPAGRGPLMTPAS